MQGIGIISMFTAGYSPSLAAITLCQYDVILRVFSSGEPKGTLFSDLQAILQA
jgi:uncharacterized membrane protein